MITLLSGWLLRCQVQGGETSEATYVLPEIMESQYSPKLQQSKRLTRLSNLTDDAIDELATQQAPVLSLFNDPADDEIIAKSRRAHLKRRGHKVLPPKAGKVAKVTV